MTPEFLNAHPLPFAKLIGLTVTRADKTLVEGEAIVRPDLCTIGDRLHGGAAMAIADTLGAIATALNLPEGAGGTTTVESKTNFLGPAKAGERVIARTTPVQIGKRLQVWQTRIETEAGRTVALTTQTQMVL